MASVADKQQARRDQQEARQIHQRIRILLRAADNSELADSFVTSDFWLKVLLPMLDQDIEAFQKDVWVCKEEDFPKLRAMAVRTRETRDAILTMVGKREEYRKEADRLAGVLEAGQAKGRIKPEDIDETP